MPRLFHEAGHRIAGVMIYMESKWACESENLVFNSSQGAGGPFCFILKITLATGYELKRRRVTHDIVSDVSCWTPYRHTMISASHHR